LCRACYLRAWRGTDLPEHAVCAICAEKRHIVLRWTRLAAEKIVTCQNCGFIADKSRPRLENVDALRARLERERRRARDRRRNYVIDSDDPAEQRHRPRRVRRRVSL
jgi:hypothetical protein